MCSKNNPSSLQNWNTKLLMKLCSNIIYTKLLLNVVFLFHSFLVLIDWNITGSKNNKIRKENKSLKKVFSFFWRNPLHYLPPPLGPPQVDLLFCVAIRSSWLIAACPSPVSLSCASFKRALCFSYKIYKKLLEW